jgi:Putative DNA-binding domain
MDQFEQMLLRGESETLDFKRAQYPFVGASDDDKGELLKDILAMANAWRSEDAFILIGVDEVSGSKAQPVGITTHLEDASVQQFVNAKTQRPIKFNSYNVEMLGRTVGVIQIPVQERPFYLSLDYGKLKKQTVYLRRGSSTDIADLDEIAKMGAPIAALGAQDIDVGFYDRSTRVLGSNSIALKAVSHDFGPRGEIPDYSTRIAVGNGMWFTNRTGVDNVDYYRDLADFAYEVGLLRPIMITAINRGKMAAREVRIELILEDPDHEYLLRTASDYPYYPPQKSSLFDMAVRAVHPVGPTVEIVQSVTSWHLTYNLGNIQPGRAIWHDKPVYIGSSSREAAEFKGLIFADSLQAPKSFSLLVNFTVERRVLTLDQLLSLEIKPDTR